MSIEVAGPRSPPSDERALPSGARSPSNTDVVVDPVEKQSNHAYAIYVGNITTPMLEGEEAEDRKGRRGRRRKLLQKGGKEEDLRCRPRRGYGGGPPVRGYPLALASS